MNTKVSSPGIEALLLSRTLTLEAVLIKFKKHSMQQLSLQSQIQHLTLFGLKTGTVLSSGNLLPRVKADGYNPAFTSQ